MPDRTDHVLAAIDGATRDKEVSSDAMRWTPEPESDGSERAGEDAVQALADRLTGAPASRAALLASGELVAAPADLMAEAGWHVPVHVTGAVFADLIEWDDDTEAVHQDEAGRWWDVLHMAAVTARRGGVVRRVPVYRVPRGGTEAARVWLCLAMGPGDQGEPVITLSLSPDL